MIDNTSKQTKIASVLNSRDCRVNFRMDERRNRQGGIRLSF